MLLRGFLPELPKFTEMRNNYIPWPVLKILVHLWLSNHCYGYGFLWILSLYVSVHKNKNWKFHLFSPLLSIPNSLSHGLSSLLKVTFSPSRK